MKGIEFYDGLTATFTNKKTKQSVSVNIDLYMDWKRKCWRFKIKDEDGKLLKSGTAVCTYKELIGRMCRKLEGMKFGIKRYLERCAKIPMKPKLVL